MNYTDMCAIHDMFTEFNNLMGFEQYCNLIGIY